MTTCRSVLTSLYWKQEAPGRASGTGTETSCAFFAILHSCVFVVTVEREFETFLLCFGY